MKPAHILFWSVTLAGWMWSGTALAQPAATPPQGDALLKTDLMFVGAHPDDETGVASTLAWHALGLGKSVACVYATRGEGGGNMVGTQSGPALGALREVELRGCLETLGVRHVYFLDELDWAYTESLQATLNKWGKEDVLEKLVRAYRMHRPEVVLTMNPAPNPGQHGHHQAAGLLAIEAFNAAADPTRFSHQLTREGLGAWQPKRLFFGGSGPGAVTLPTDRPMADGRQPGDIAGAALSQHRSQGFGGFVNSPWLRRPQSFVLIQSAVDTRPSESDLFFGLEGAKLSFPASKASARAAALSVAFVPRPAISRYTAWMEAQGLGELASTYAVDLPCVVDRPNKIRLKVANPTSSRVSAPVRFFSPEGWRLNRELAEVTLGPGESREVEVDVTPPAGARKDVEFTAKFGDLEARCALHPLPIAKITRLRGGKGAELANSGLPTEAIDPSMLVQGKVDGPFDSSGAFSVAFDGSALHVWVEVKDNHIVSNIEPNDIKGHWRSDSVEICIDPAGGAEDTMGSFKLGIFPFDSTGVVRGARDADANGGPVERTAPKTQISSSRTPGGYRVRAVIPLEEIGIKNPRKGQAIGFNVIIYDGDKLDAATGENINKSRLAWSPRPGVQGRPEDWGRLLF